MNVKLQVEDFKVLIDSNSVPNPVEVETHDDANTTVELEYNQSVLVFWPESKSFQVALHHRFDYLLSQLNIENNEQSCFETLRSILNHENEWQKTVERICKLLTVCQRLKAHEEAVFLLNMLASSGVTSDDLAVVLAQIENDLLGWPFSKPILEKFLIVNSLSNLQYFVTLAVNLFTCGSLDAFTFVADTYLDLFFSVKLKQSAGKPE